MPRYLAAMSPLGKPLDDLDRRLLAELRGDGRTSTRALAATLGVSKPTVAARIKRLDEQSIARVVAVTDFEAFGFTLLSIARVKVEGRGVREVAEELAAIEEVVGVTIVLGPVDIMLLLLARDTRHLAELLAERIPAIAGVREVDADLALEVHKYESRWARFG
jgi:Lrp/AsnC family transcriptional regulator for asnA, asnC and gidA